MLNYIWISLVAIGILVAVGNDLSDEMKNSYRNGVPLEARLEIKKYPTELRTTWEGDLVIPKAAFEQFYGLAATESAGEVRQQVTISTAASGESALLMAVGESTPALWKEMAKYAAAKDKLAGSVQSIRFAEDRKTASVQIVLEPIRFVKLKAVTTAALDSAKTAVEIAIGLIGIMALWLGVMKVAEEAGLIKVLTRLLRPISKRLFPDVPPDHPAIGAIIMNLSANMLGLSNAATPFGLKAMEELNKLNPKVGTATNAMCTFLVINTSGLVLIPATAIAVRAASGSANPGIIIGTSIFGAGCATLAGLIAVKILEKLPRYKKELLVETPQENDEVRHG
ncbi:MAG TPA: nucleoside recognition domain-containing protein [Bacteroidota bacterium]